MATYKVEQGCMSCGMCAEECIAKVISFKSTGGYGTASIDDTKCVGCGKCAKICPAECIKPL